MKLKPEELQSYIDAINEIQYAKNKDDLALFDSLQIEEYANALEGVSSSQAALLLSTQGLSNAHIAETLAVKEGSTAKAYDTMVEAGLLKSKQSLEYAELQNIIAIKVGNEEYAKAIMNHMGLTVATNGEGVEVTKLTSKKLKQLVATGLLTEAQAQEIAMIAGVTVATKAQVSTVLPEWIAKINASTVAIWGQVKATAVWMATNPVGWITAAVTAIIGLISSISLINKHIEKSRKEIIETGEAAKENINDIRNEVDKLKDAVDKATESYDRLLTGVNTLSNKNLNLSDEDFEEFLDTNNQLAELFPELVIGMDASGNAILSLGDNAENAARKLNELLDAKQKLLAEETHDNMTDIFKGLFESTRDARKELEQYEKHMSGID